MASDLLGLEPAQRLLPAPQQRPRRQGHLGRHVERPRPAGYQRDVAAFATDSVQDPRRLLSR
eukprot:COSAG02_NODE_23539_length_715_cov_1.667208_2_plen_61_part_01